MDSLPEHARRLLEEATRLPYRIEEVPTRNRETTWQVLIDPSAKTTRRLGTYETIVGAAGRINGEIIVWPRVKGSLARLTRKLDGKEVELHLLADRDKWSGLKRLVPHTLKFLRDIDSTVEDINREYGSDVEIHLDREKAEWWLQVRFRSSGLSADESVERLERNVKAFAKVLREYHVRMEFLKI